MYTQSQYVVRNQSWRNPGVWEEKNKIYYTPDEAIEAGAEDHKGLVKFLDEVIEDPNRSEEAKAHARHVCEKQRWDVIERIKNFTHATEHMYSDKRAWEIVRVVSDKTIDIRRVNSDHHIGDCKQVSGGFFGHVVDQHNQKVTYTSNPDNEVIRIRRRKDSDSQWTHKGVRFTLQTEPYAFHDFNF